MQTQGVEPVVDIWQQSVQKDIIEMKEDIRKLQDKTLLQDQSIATLQSTLTDIKDDTKWLKRTITAALITAVCTGVIGGAIAIFYNLLQK
ncbi:hemolysin XhlA family protein [Niallia taxi]|uniref:hemolysin XhlA family protein n=1 Tax=Niallia taxi TaxID=2499688 RepID=UPI0015F60DA8|nr:hemolysin XhlA family protein [Niallia taxi]